MSFRRFLGGGAHGMFLMINVVDAGGNLVLKKPPPYCIFLCFYLWHKEMGCFLDKCSFPGTSRRVNATRMTSYLSKHATCPNSRLITTSPTGTFGLQIKYVCLSPDLPFCPSYGCVDFSDRTTHSLPLPMDARASVRLMPTIMPPPSHPT